MMKSILVLRRPRYLPVCLVAVVALLSVTVWARTTLTGTTATINITVTNNSQKEIRHLYVAAGDPNNWGPDRLNSGISSGSSFTVSGVACDSSSIRVIAEDQNGCFYYNTVSCDANVTWTITDSSTADCGG